jgi:DNA (cytosine-5)-methyltransferase 1
MRRGVEFEFPYDKKSFKDRYTRQSRWEACSTIVAHLSRDGLMFIHPTQNRSLTPREAARIQSFPDWYEFPIARTHQFRVIGNAVPPLVSEAVGIAVKSYLEKTMKKFKPLKFDLAPLPKDEQEAVHWLLPLLDLDKKALHSVSQEDFKRAWYSIAFLYVGLHPDSATDHGKRISNETEDYMPVSRIEPRLMKPYFEQSGWPVVLAPIAKEAWRRYENDELEDDEFYCSEAQMAGICHRSADLAEDVRQHRTQMVA